MASVTEHSRARGWNSTNDARPLLQRITLGSAVLLLAIALAVGGAGSRYPILGLAVELAALPILFLFGAGWSKPIDDRSGNVALVLLGLILLLPLAQLVRLPPSLWHGLPGREWAADLLSLVGSYDKWMPVSLDPEATWFAFLSLLPGAAMFIAVLQFTGRERELLVKIVLGFAFLGALVGAFQAAVAGAAIFESGHAGLATGLFVNRNHQATFLNVAIVLSAAVARIAGQRDSRLWSAAFLAAILVFVAGVLATRSRAGAAVLLISLPAAFLLLRSKSRRLFGAFYILVAVMVVLALAVWTSAGEVVVSRLGGSFEDARFPYWSEAWIGARQYWPVGSGLGTFADIYQTVEPLALVGPAYVNHAHNDYLQLLLEGGIAALLLIVATMSFLTWRMIAALKNTSDSWQVLARAAGVGLLIIAVHSIVDYPLRMLSLITVCGLLAGLLVPPAHARKEPMTVSGIARWVQRGVAAAAAAFLAYQALLLHSARGAVRSGHTPTAESIMPASSEAATFVARQRMAGGDIDGATDAALIAIRSAPLESGATAVLALATAYRGDSVGAARLLDFAIAGGWRDQFVQWWLLNSAIASGQSDVAAQRADALLRQGMLRNEVAPLLRHLISTPAGRAAVAERLADRPGWRTPFLTSLAGLKPEQLADHADLLLAMHKRDQSVSREEAAPIVQRLLDSQQFERARSVWANLDGRSRNGLVIDGGFERLGAISTTEAATPFEWKFNRPLGIAATVEMPPAALSEVALKLVVDAGVAGNFVEQTILLSSGGYSLELAASGPPGDVQSLLRPTLTCFEGPVLDVQPRGLMPGRWSRIIFDFQVPAACEVQRLGIGISGTGLSRTEMWIDNVSIRRR